MFLYLMDVVKTDVKYSGTQYMVRIHCTLTISILNLRLSFPPWTAHRSIHRLQLNALYYKFNSTCLTQSDLCGRHLSGIDLKKLSLQETPGI